MPDQIHIASFVVHVRPEQSAALLDYLADEPALEVHAAAPEGKLILVLESPDQGGVIAAIDRIGDQPGVLNCVLIYHETMTVAEGDHELIDLVEKTPA
jgi:nitrate reductase NapD